MTNHMDVCCECCVLSGRGLCDEPITRPEESYRLWCVVVCDLEIKWMRPWSALDRSATREYFPSGVARETNGDQGEQISSFKNISCTQMAIEKQVGQF